MVQPRLLTFDCYGTLIDWCGGLSLALSRLGLPEDIDRDQLFDRYVALEHEVETGAYASYRDVTSRAMERTLQEAGRELSSNQRAVLADSIPDWLPFEESTGVLQELARHAPLAILSNIDDDLLATSVAKLGVPFEHLITAEQVRSYKPAHGHFLEIRKRSGLDADQILHVGASLLHDMIPCRDLGIPSVWINRRSEQIPDWFPSGRALPDLRALPAFAFGTSGQSN
jgi:2-haloacid dehalogenase